MTVKGGTSQACAACKYQRRRCTAECPLAPYFPPDMPRQFQNAHRLFGVSKILKIIDKLEPPYKTEAMRSIVYESNVRERYPIRGCVELIHTLLIQIHHVKCELDYVKSQIDMYRQHCRSLSPPPVVAAADSTANCLPLFDSDYYFGVPVSEAVKSDIDVNGMKDVDQLFWAHDQLNVNESAHDDSMISVVMPGFHALSSGTSEAIEQDYYDEKPSYLNTEQTYESSSDSSPKDTMTIENYGMDSELKNA